MSGEWDQYTPCDAAYHQAEHAPHSYTWADAHYECRGYPARVVISRRSEAETVRLFKHIYDGDDMDNSVGPLYIQRFVSPVEYQQKEAFRHRLMDWFMTLTSVECYILATAALLSAAILFFTVVWTWVMF